MIDQTRTEIESHIAVLRRRVERIEKDLARVNNPLSGDSEERAITLENDEVLDALEKEGRSQIALLEAALQRIDAGVYGLCDSCKKRISAARLKALPHATSCIECAEAAEAR